MDANVSNKIKNSVIGGAAVAAIFFGIELWMEGIAGDVVKGIYVKFPNTLGYIFWFILITGVSIYIVSQIKEHYEKIIEQKDILLQDSAKQVWEKYTDLFRFKQMEVIKGQMRKLVESEDYLISSQLYKYSLRQEKKTITIKLNHVCSYMAEGEDLNALEQIYFKINKKVYFEYLNAMEAIKEYDIVTALGFVRKYVSKLQKKDMESLDYNDAYIFSMVCIVSQLVDSYQDNVDRAQLLFPLDDIEKVRKFEEMQRIGVLSAILSEMYYISYNTTSMNKMGRAYLTKPLLVDTEKNIILITTKPYADNRYNTAHSMLYFIKKQIKLFEDANLLLQYQDKELEDDLELESRFCLDEEIAGEEELNNTGEIAKMETVTVELASAKEVNSENSIKGKEC